LSDEFLGRLEPGTGENEGKMYVSLSQMEAGPMRSSENGETRKKVSMALARRCKKNIPLFKEAVLLRDEAARLLGYHSHAALRLEDRCAGAPDTVITFLNSLRDRLRGQGMREYEVLRLLKKADMESRGKPFDGHLFHWDAPVYHMQIRKQSAVDSKKIAEYFPVQTTLSGMLTIVEHLFGLVFVELGSEERHRLSPSGNGNDMAWHEDVQIFSTWDDEEEGGDFLGYLYVDLFRRPRKHDHVSVFNLMPVCVCVSGFSSFDWND
jgi:metallopeptidase MepB